MRIKRSIILIFFLFIFFIYICNISNIPSRIVLMDGERIDYKTLLGIEIKPIKREVIETWRSGELEMSNYEVSLFGSIPLKEVSVTSIPKLHVIPLGNLIGLKLYTNGVLVVGMSEIENSENNMMVKPYGETQIREGDTIVSVNNNPIDCIDTLKKVVNSSNGDELIVDYIKQDGTIMSSTIVPVLSNDEYKLGLWVRDSATGVGTISFYEPESGKFAALGHGIIDSDTGGLIEIESGEIVSSKIVSVDKAKVGNPGEIKGSISNGTLLGQVKSNTGVGIYGTLSNLDSLNIDVQKTVEVANRDEITKGEASILATLDNGSVGEYKIEITNIDINNNSDNKSMQFKVIDEKLIDKTGGIICGMSGSPIIQNGKFIGVVTNVLVSNPEVGYGVFADLMIKEMMK